MSQKNESTAAELQEIWNTANDANTKVIEDAKAADASDLMFDLQLQTHKTINLLGFLTGTLLDYAEATEYSDEQQAFYALAAIFADRKAALVALTERF